QRGGSHPGADGCPAGRGAGPDLRPGWLIRLIWIVRVVWLIRFVGVLFGQCSRARATCRGFAHGPPAGWCSRVTGRRPAAGGWRRRLATGGAGDYRSARAQPRCTKHRATLLAAPTRSAGLLADALSRAPLLSLEPQEGSPAAA